VRAIILVKHHHQQRSADESGRAAEGIDKRDRKESANKANSLDARMPITASIYVTVFDDKLAAAK